MRAVAVFCNSKETETGGSRLVAGAERIRRATELKALLIVGFLRFLFVFDVFIYSSFPLVKRGPNESKEKLGLDI